MTNSLGNNGMLQKVAVINDFSFCDVCTSRPLAVHQTLRPVIRGNIEYEYSICLFPDSFKSIGPLPGNERFTNELIELELNAGLLWNLR